VRGSRARAEADLNRLYLIVGGAIVVVLFAALIVPLFVNWDSYKANFEREATRIVGHPVHVGGAARVRILPSPSVTFTDVEVGGADGDPIVTVETFSATIELMSLLQGEVRVLSMTLDRPHLKLTADELAGVGWLKPPPANSRGDRVVLGSVQVNDGTLTYMDTETGIALAFGGITASVAADSLAGPWRLEGTYLEGERSVPFRFATGRQLEDGTIRLQADVSPPSLPVRITADGVLANRPLQGFTYTGTYNAGEMAGEKAVPAGWRSQGTFALSRGKVAVDKAVLSNGAAERPTSVAGSLVLNFGKQASFTASAEARQIDLDRALAGGPGQPVNVAATAQAFFDRIVAWPLPTIPGRIAFNVPGIVVGGSVVQDVSLVAEVAADGWKLSGVRARLPGQALVEADGMLSLRRGASFAGHARLAAAQPGAFASWWRGSTEGSAGRLLPAFDVSGDATLSAGRIDIDKLSARIGEATLSGRVSWGTVKNERALSTDLKADRLNFADIRALADLVAGRELSNTSAVADSFAVRVAADELQIDTTAMQGVSVDASYSGDTLNVVQLGIADLGGASFRLTSGRIDALTTDPHGHLDARLEAQSFDALTAIAGKLLPGSGVSEWLARTAPVLAPAVLNARISAPPKNGSGFQVSVDGVAGDTTFSGAVQSAVSLKDVSAWRATPSVFSFALDSPDSAALARQFGFAAAESENVPDGHISAKGNGIPKDGLDSVIDLDFAGGRATAQGKMVLAGGVAPSFNGTFSIAADDLAPLMATGGLTIPGAPSGTPVAIAGTASASGGAIKLTWKDGTVADHAVSGTAEIARLEDHTWRVGGALDADDVDLGWLASLSLGFAPEISDNPRVPWSKTNFSPPTYGPVNGKVSVATKHLYLGDLDITGGTLALALQPNRLDVDLKNGQLSGGAAGGGVSIQNVDGGAALTGQFNLTGVQLDDLVWQRGGQPVLSGGLDLSANFEATGRSPAALVSSMTGGGVIAVHNGVARNLNPATGQVIVRLADLGEPFSEAGLKDAVADQIEREPLPFGDTGGAFTIAGGALRASGITARGPGVDLLGNVAIDLGQLALATDWTATFSALEPVAGGADPKIGIAFRGPLAAPVRTVDALPLNSYLSTRQAARMLDVIATEEADRTERQRLQQQIVKLRDDNARIERARQQAIETARRRAEIAAAVRLRVAALHVDRETAFDARYAAMLARSAELAAAGAAKAASDAEGAAALAASQRAAAEEAQRALTIVVQADTIAATAAAKAKADLDAAKARATVAAEAATDAANKAAALEAAAGEAASVETQARATAAKAAASRSAAGDALNAANEKTTAARAAADAASADANEARLALDAAGKAVSDVARTREASVQALAAAESALAIAITFATQTSDLAKKAKQAATEADAERARLEMVARSAVDAQRSAEAARDAARAEAEAARQQYSVARTELSAAEQADVTNTSLQVVTKRSTADHLKQMLDIANNKLVAAEADLGTLAAKAALARADADVAIGKAQDAQTAAQQASASDAAAQASVTQKQRERDAAAFEAQARQADAQRAGAAFNAAETENDKAAQRALDFADAARAAETEQGAASKASAVSGAGVEGFALEQAHAKSVAAEAAAREMRASADAAQSAAVAASQAVSTLQTAYDDAVRQAAAAHAARLASEKTAQAAIAAASEAEAAARLAADDAKRLAADAEAAARRVQPAAGDAKPSAPPPAPRQRPKPLTLIPDAMAGDAPLQITPSP
jgi:uncharacterized protein involved in outer membrane biogenesis